MSSEELAKEQEYVSMLYSRLDALRGGATNRLARVLRQTGGTFQARGERDATSTRYANQLARYDAVEHGLCFGRLDLDDGEPRYIGRLGIFDESGDYEPLLIDWRAPAARPFYLATAASPGGVRRRRHIKTRFRTVVGLDDDILDLAAADRHEGLTGEAALLAALNASRTGRLKDIVETIQAEQDRVIRSGHRGVLVVDGGPGTGKTAVALHRAAYLLYTYRRELSRNGVLIVGPNGTFLRYIERVLPSLGETGVLLSTIGDLYPGVSAHATERPEVAEIKGRLVMADVLAATVGDRQRVPDDARDVVVEGDTFPLDRRSCVRARDIARRSRLPHNLARPVFVRELTAALARHAADRRGGDDLLGEADTAEIRRELAEDPDVRKVIDELWPVLTPQGLLGDLWASGERLSSAAPSLTTAERSRLLRDPGGGWTPADIPLLDELAELLGEDDRPARARAALLRRAQVAEAQGVLDILAGSAAHELDDPDPEILMAYDLMDADRLAERQEEPDGRTVAQRAAADRTWAFGHVIVDEAQELSEMAWRMLMRRCPSRSMTVVGDLAQTGDPAGTSSWQRVLGPYVDRRWQLERLTVNYRTPAEIMAVAAEVLPDVAQPRSVRETGVEPWRTAVAPALLGARVAGIVAREVGDERLAVIVPAARFDDVRRAVTGGLPDGTVADDPDLDRPVVVLTVTQAKGLEFDSVLVVDPDGILAASPRGPNDLYVALTRATQRLGVIHTGEPPATLAWLRPRAPGRRLVDQ